MMGLTSFLMIAAALFAIGVACIVSRKNIIHMLMGVELIFNAAVLNFVAFDHFVPKVSTALHFSGQVFGLFIIVLAAAEAAVALALVLCVNRVFGSVDVGQINKMKG